MANFTDLVNKCRQIAQVDHEVVKQWQGGDEQEHCREALRQYSLDRPYVDAVLVPDLTASQDPIWSLPSLITGWSEDSHHVQECYCRTGGERSRLPGWTVAREAGVSKLFFDYRPGEFWLRYSKAHDPDATFVFPLVELDAVAHLAAALCLEQAANYHGRQYNRSMSADVSNTEQQSLNYAMRARDQRAIYRQILEKSPQRGSQGSSRANWSSRGVLGKDKFWEDRYA